MSTDVDTDADALGVAMRDYQRGGLRGECRYVDGAETVDAHVRENYFGDPEQWRGATRRLLDSLAGPVVDVGCGAGNHALYLQERVDDVVAFDVSPGAVEAARERGVKDAVVADMFEMAFPRDRFRSAWMYGTQLGLAGSLAGVSSLLSKLGYVTDEAAVAVVDSYDPRHVDAAEMIGYRPDPRDGVARRAFHFEYDRDGERLVGRTLSFVLFGPERLRDATVGTPWSVGEVHERPTGGHYRAVLEKE
ncbi:Methyltransferase domain-containing protein [Halogranum amylolyticum]|uniref:Methyltransferase domain-containing protein n=1 Tax=Halogranum amylolyticum TaxID=660520 RepID=A0A1H8SN51_9EURY|nr:class I SAM-dependent methyltransferase [Halogranum amylolyticum]SEO80399.1 Methyltransferase domain-containing protein [Halogranum amylolyticum]